MSELSIEAFEFIREIVFLDSAIALDLDKHYLVETRLRRLVQKENIEHIDQVVTGLRDAANQELRQKVVEVMTTNETSFFRDMPVFDALREHVFPQIDTACVGPVNVWCAAAASGQEPYSLLMLLHQHFADLAERTRLLATDLSQEMVEATVNGRYSQLEINRGLPVQLLPAYFEKIGLGWDISAELRRRLTVKQMNLAADWPTLPKMNLILMRNVLIYFNLDTKKRILNHIKQVLEPGGLLVLGAAETTLTLDADFQRVQYGQSHFYQLRKTT